MVDPEDPQAFSVPPQRQALCVPIDPKAFSVPPHSQGFNILVDLQALSSAPHPQAFNVPIPPEAFTVHDDPQAFSVPPYPQAFSAPVDPKAFSVPVHLQALSVPPHPQAFTVPVAPPQVFNVPIGPPHDQTFNVPVDPPHPQGRFFTLSMWAKKDIPHASIVAIILFLIFFGYFYVHLELELLLRRSMSLCRHGYNHCREHYLHRWIVTERASLAIQIVSFLAIACLYIWVPSSRKEKIASCVFLGVFFDFLAISASSFIEFMFAANTVAISSYCIWKLYSVAEPWLQYCISKLYRIARPWIQNSQPWLQYLLRNSTFLLMHGSIIAILLLHIILAQVCDNLFMQIVAYLAIACLYIWSPSNRMEKIVSGAFLGALTLIVDFFGISAGNLSLEGISEILFIVNIVAISSYCILMLYRVAEPWLQHCISDLYPVAPPWLQYLHGNITIILLHGSIIVSLLFHIILAKVYDNLTMQIVAYPAIVCLYIWAPSSRTQKIVSSAFLGALAFIVILVSIIPKRVYDHYYYYGIPRDKQLQAGLDSNTMFTANIVAMLSYYIWKLYLVAKPWLHYWFWKVYPITRPLFQYLPALAPRFQEEEETGPLLPHQARFRIQDLPRQFSPSEIRAMTEDFQTMVGQGGFAQVFRGLLDGTAVAVKRITTTGHAKDDFLREVSIVANVHHRSLVRLLGYCLPRGGSRRYLVYPFLENGSLDSWLFHGGETRRRLLPWSARRRVAVDVAKALAYLHHECHQQILHLDIKPGNILLDGDLRAHVSDFGISMSVTPDLSNVDTRGRGTPGYMAPEMMVNAVSAKSDVFSYGMTLLELVGGRRKFEPANADASSETPDFTRDFFPYIVREKMERGELMEAVDAAMALVDGEEVETVVKVALSCIQSRWDMRPSMLAVVDMLEGRVAVGLPPESRRLLTVNFSDLLSSSLTYDR